MALSLSITCTTVDSLDMARNGMARDCFHVLYNYDDDDDDDDNDDNELIWGWNARWKASSRIITSHNSLHILTTSSSSS
jgi:hypothetical protein